MPRRAVPLVITHRLETIQYADVIAVMKAGHIVEVGEYKKLMDKKGEYYQMVCTSSFDSSISQLHSHADVHIPI